MSTRRGASSVTNHGMAAALKPINYLNAGARRAAEADRTAGSNMRVPTHRPAPPLSKTENRSGGAARGVIGGDVSRFSDPYPTCIDVTLALISQS